MFVRSVTASAFGTQCYIVAGGPGREALIVDPGMGVAQQVRDVLAQEKLRPAAILLTHGHYDHVASVTPLCSPGVAAYIHPDDRYRLVDPKSSLDPGMVAMLEREFGSAYVWQEPEDVIEFDVGSHQPALLSLAGLDITLLPAPGHTEGSVMFSLTGVPQGIPDVLDQTVFSGDVLFAGSIGRTDLPGGDSQAMQRSLRDVVLPLSDTALVLPGHGPATTIGRERGTNPHLAAIDSGT